MTDRYYPDLPEGSASSLALIRAQLGEDPAYLDDPGCPYSAEDVRLLKDIIGVRKGPASEAAIDDDEEISETFDGDILDSVNELYRQLKDFGSTMDERSDAKDKAAYFRVAVALTDKIITLRERSQKLKDWNSFKGHLMAWLENVDPDLRTDFMDRIKDWN